ncbi:MAG: hypothetical protein ACP5OU_08080 [Methanothrix sp.]
MCGADLSDLEDNESEESKEERPKKSSKEEGWVKRAPALEKSIISRWAAGS